MASHRFFRSIPRSLVQALPGVVLVACAPSSPAQTPPLAHSQSPAAIIGSVRHSALAGGIDDRRFISIGGIQQWISVQGRHKDAPILLFLHGGPGLPTIPTSWYFLPPWEEYVTVAQWDQRGSGKTFAANPAADIASTLTLPQMVSDAEEVVSWLRQTYGRRKIILVGFSWGSILGEMLAQRHPDWFYAYVGMGQVVQMQENDRRNYQDTLADARHAGDAKAVAALESIAPFPEPPGQPLNGTKFAIFRQQVKKYGGVLWRGSTTEMDALGKLSPDYDAADFDAGMKGLGFSFIRMWPTMSKIDFSHDTHFALPVVFLHGRHDRVISASLLSEWFATLKAPSKTLIWFNDSGHYVYQEEPGKMLVTLVKDILPLAKPAQPTEHPEWKRPSP